MIEEIIQRHIYNLPYSYQKKVWDFIERVILEAEPLPHKKEPESLNIFEEIMKISKRCSSLPDMDLRSSDEILNYNHLGVPG